MKLLKIAIFVALSTAFIISFSNESEVSGKPADETVRTVEHAMGSTEIKGKPE